MIEISFTNYWKKHYLPDFRLFYLGYHKRNDVKYIMFYLFNFAIEVCFIKNLNGKEITQHQKEIMKTKLGFRKIKL